MDLIQRNLAALRKKLQLRLGQIAVTQLDGSQFVKNHFELAREHAPLLANRLGRLIGSTLFPHTHPRAVPNNS
jgi:hypothetical protein